MERSLYDISSEINRLCGEVTNGAPEINVCEAFDQAIKFLGLVMGFGVRLGELKKLVYSGNQDPDILKECAFGVIWWATLSTVIDLRDNAIGLDKKAFRAAILSRVEPKAMSVLNLNNTLLDEYMPKKTYRCPLCGDEHEYEGICDKCRALRGELK